METGSGGAGVTTAGEGAPSASAATVDVEASSLRFVYPFVFDGATLGERAEALRRLVWPAARRGLQVWRPRAFPADELAAHVAEFVRERPDDAAASFWRMDDDALRSPAGLGGGDQHPGAEWSLVLRSGALPLRITGVELALFRHGVGLLTLAVRPVSADPAAWFDTLHFLRTVDQASATLRAVRAREHGASEAYVPPPLAPAAEVSLAALLDGILRGAGEGRWWEEIFVPGTLLPYSVVFLDGAAAEKPALVLYRLRNAFHSRQQLHPSVRDLDERDPSLLPYAQQQWFHASLNGGGFVAFDAPRTSFFRSMLPAHLADRFLLLFLLALLQRFVLMRLSREVSRQWVGRTDEGDRVAAFESIRDDFLAFTAQAYFVQPMQTEHHHRFYTMWQRTFELDRLHAEVETEVREMHGWLDMRQRARAERIARQQEVQAAELQRRLDRVGWVLGVPIYLFLFVNSLLGVATFRALFHGDTSVHWYDALIDVGIFTTGLGLGYLVYRRIRGVQRR